MNLVTDQDNVMARAHISHRAQFFCTPDAATGIMRRTQEQQPLITGERALQRRQIHMEAVILDTQR